MLGARIFLCTIDAPPESGGAAKFHTLNDAMGMADTLGPAPAPQGNNGDFSVSVSTHHLNTAAHLGEASATLSTHEAARARQFHKTRDCEKYILAHGALRTLLAATLETPPADLQFISGKSGKPKLSPTRPGVEFNLSYGDGQIAIALAPRPLGIDIERLRDGVEFVQIGQRFFTAAELDYLRAAHGSALRDRFFHIWTRKEALLKSMGSGLKSVSEIDVLSDVVEIPRTSSTPRRYAIAMPASPPGHALALALEID